MRFRGFAVAFILLNLAMCWVIQAHSQGPLFSPAPGSPVTVGEGPGQVELADINGDGKLDLVTRHLLQSLIRVQTGDGTGRFVATSGSPINLKYQPGAIKLADINGDKILDLGVTNSDRDAVDIFIGNGKGGFSLAPGSPFIVSAAVEFYTRSLNLIDLNKDGKLDIVTANHHRNTFSTLFGNGRGGFTPGPATTFPFDPGDYSFAFGDMDGDGHLDVVVASGERGSSEKAGRIVLLRGDGKGVFKEIPAPPLSIPAGPHGPGTEANPADVNAQGASFSFYLKPQFYQTHWFLMLAAAAIVLIVGLLCRLRVMELKARYSAVLAERNRIACEIHDTLAQNLAGVALQLDSVTMQLPDIPAGMRERLDQACALTRYSLAEARRAVGDLRSDELERQELAVALPEIAAHMAANAALHANVQIVGSPRKLNPMTEKNLLRIFQEAMANAVRHAQAQTIAVELKYASDHLILRVQDDGSGFDTRKIIPFGIGHYGLTGMRERAERIGGRLILKSQPGEGTELLVEVPFSA